MYDRRQRMITELVIISFAFIAFVLVVVYIAQLLHAPRVGTVGSYPIKEDHVQAVRKYVSAAFPFGCSLC